MHPINKVIKSLNEHADILHKEVNMKTLNLMVMVSSVVILAAGSAYADEDYTKTNISKQNLSKRPYQQVVDRSVDKQKDNFEGATLIDEKVEAEGKNKRMRLNMLSKRPY